MQIADESVVVMKRGESQCDTVRKEKSSTKEFFLRIQWIVQSQKPEELRRDEGKWKLKRKEQRNFVKEATDS